MRNKLVRLDFRKGPEDESGITPSGWNGKTLLHVAVHRGWQGKDESQLNFNAGDTALNPLVRNIIDLSGGPYRWILRQVWDSIDAPTMRALQSEVDGIVIGGGGLFLREQPGTDLSKSGWTWNCSVAALGEVVRPVVVFAVGYNRFRGHSEFDGVFFEHINKLAAKSSFFGLRNNGSISALSRYLEPPNRDKLKLQVCPTTLIWQLRPAYRELALATDRAGKRILVLNAAFDRAKLRFGDEGNRILGGIASAMRRAQDQGWTIRVVAHKTMDLEMEPHLDHAQVTYDTYDVSAGSSDDLFRFYAEADLVVGLRGHAQMIPFGLRRPIISVISHDKMRFFLDDIGHPEWGADVTDQDFEARLSKLIEQVAENPALFRQQVAEAQERLWTMTQPNIEQIKEIFMAEGRR